MIRMNRMGQKFEITEESNPAYGHRTTIALVGTDKKITVDYMLETINQAWYCWQMRGDFLQDAFRFLSDDEREFILTGTTKEEWDKLFGEDE